MLEIFKCLEKYDYERVVFCQDQASRLKAVIAIHDTTLGPALGGCRMWTYATEDAAIEDALRLAEERIARVAKSPSLFLRDERNILS